MKKLMAVVVAVVAQGAVAADKVDCRKYERKMNELAGKSAKTAGGGVTAKQMLELEELDPSRRCREGKVTQAELDCVLAKDKGLGQTADCRR